MKKEKGGPKGAEPDVVFISGHGRKEALMRIAQIIAPVLIKERGAMGLLRESMPTGPLDENEVEAEVNNIVLAIVSGDITKPAFATDAILWLGRLKAQIHLIFRDT